MIATAQRKRSFIELYDLTPEIVAFLCAFCETTPSSNDLEPLILPAVLRGVTWRSYKSFLRATRSRYLRHSYHDGVLELMSPRTFERENTKSILRRFIHALTLETSSPIVTLGCTTLCSPSQALGIEPDEAFRFASRIEFPSALYLDIDFAGWADLAIEVGQLAKPGTDARVSAVEINRVALLTRLSVREVWLVERGTVRIIHARHGRPTQSEHSNLFPRVTGLMLTRHLRNRHRIGENACVTEFVAEALTA